MIKSTISFPDFAKLDLRVGKVIEATEMVGSDKLVRMTVDLGEEVGIRSILAGLRPALRGYGPQAGIRESYPTKDLIGKLIVVLVNLEYRKMMGEESQGMILAAEADGKPILLKPAKKVKPGTIIK